MNRDARAHDGAVVTFARTSKGYSWLRNSSKTAGDRKRRILVLMFPRGFGTAFALVYIVTLKTDSEGNPIGDQESLPFMVSGLSAILLLWYILQFVEEDKRDPTTNLGFSSALLTTFPGLINAVKLAPEYGPPIVAAADVVCNFANLFVAIVQANSLSSPS
jgi:hypothetical protein